MGVIDDLSHIFKSTSAARSMEDMRRDHEVEVIWDAVELANRRAGGNGESPDRFATKILMAWMLEHTSRHGWLKAMLFTVLVSNIGAITLSAYALATR